MSNEITIKNGQELSGGREVVAAAYKKIKVSGGKRANIEAMRDKLLSELNAVSLDKFDVEESPIVEERIKVDFPKIEESVVEEKVVPKVEPIVEEKVEVSEEPMVFAYKSNKFEEEIDPEKIQEIKGLGSSYKGVPRSEVRKVIDKKSVEEPKKVTTEMFNKELNQPCYSDKTSKYKEEFAEKYKEINDRLEAQVNETKRIMAMYMDATETGAALLKKQNEAKINIDGINALQLDFLMDNKDEESINVLRGLETLFNKNKEIIISTTAQIKENDQRKAEIGENEQASKNKARQIEKEKADYEESVYDKLVEANKRDARVYEAENGLTEFTGIADDEVKTVKSISSMESPAMNRFESLREQPIVEEPKTIGGVNQFMNGESYGDMSFGRRVL